MDVCPYPCVPFSLNGFESHFGYKRSPDPVGGRLFLPVRGVSPAFTEEHRVLTRTGSAPTSEEKNAELWEGAA